MAEGLKILFAGQEVWLLKEKAIWWPAVQTLIVSDLHLGKGVSFTAQGLSLPPYDIMETLQRLKDLIHFYRPQTVVCLGDNFHRKHSYEHLSIEEKNVLHFLIHSPKEWCWIYGNHDAQLPSLLPGNKYTLWNKENIDFLHDFSPTPSACIIGHFHPKYTFTLQRQRISKPCYAWNTQVLIMPSFGAYTGGLEVSHPAIQQVLGSSFQICLADTSACQYALPVCF